MSGGFSLAAPGMGLPRWGCQPRRVPSGRQQWPRCAQQEQGHSLQGPSPPAPCAAPQRGLLLSRPWGTEWVPSGRLRWSLGPDVAQLRGALPQNTLIFAPKSSLQPLLPILCHHLGVSGAFLVIFRCKQTQSHPAAIETHLAVVTSPSFQSVPTQGPAGGGER